MVRCIHRSDKDEHTLHLKCAGAELPASSSCPAPTLTVPQTEVSEETHSLKFLSKFTRVLRQKPSSSCMEYNHRASSELFIQSPAAAGDTDGGDTFPGSRGVFTPALWGSPAPITVHVHAGGTQPHSPAGLFNKAAQSRIYLHNATIHEGYHNTQGPY